MSKMQAKQCDRCGFLAANDDERMHQFALRKRNQSGNWQQDEVRDICAPCAERLLKEWFRPAAQSAFGDMGSAVNGETWSIEGNAPAVPVTDDGQA